MHLACRGPSRGAEVERVSRAAPSRGERAAHARTGVTQPARLRGVSWKPQPCAESEVLWKSSDTAIVRIVVRYNVVTRKNSSF